MAGYLSIALFTAVAGIFGVYGTKSMLEFLEGGEKHFRSIVESATDVNAFVKNASDHVFLYLTLHDSNDKERFFTYAADLNREIANLDDKIGLPRARQHLERIREAAKRFELLGTSLIKNHDEAMRIEGRFLPENHRLMVATLYEEGTTVRQEAVELAKFQTDFLNRQEAITAATELSSHAKRASGHLFLYLTLHEKTDQEKFFQRCAALKSHTAILRQRERGSEGERMLDRVEADAKELERVGKALICLHDSGLTTSGQFVAAGHEGLVRKLHELANGNQLAGRTLARLNVEREMTRKADAMQSAAGVRTNILLVMAGAGLFALFLGFVWAKSISDPIAELTQAVQEVGSGKRDIRLKVRCADEIGLLAASFNRMVEELRETTVSRDYLNSIISSMAESLIVTRADGIIERTNQAAQTLLGYAPEALLDKPIDICFSNKSDSHSIIEYVKERGSILSTERTFISSDGRTMPVSISASIIPARDSGTSGIVWVALDITERRAKQNGLNAQLLHAQKMEAIGTLAGGIAHDFNNLLTVVLGYSELMLAARDPADPEYEDLERIVHAATSGADLAHRLLAFSGRTQPKRSRMNLNTQIVQTEKLLRRTIPTTIHIQLDLADNLPEIHADPFQVEQVLMNLAVNARDAMPHGGKLTVETGTAQGWALRWCPGL
jgi:PAS domain S-box-containing protein